MNIYVVQRGDTLSRIAQRFGVTVARIVQVNQLPDPDVLVVGQALVIPTPARAVHVVRPGETLWAISNRYGVTIQDIARENRITNPSLIYVGQTLVIPAPDRGIHVVQPGETLWSIANQYGLTVQDMVRENQITNPSLIYAGQRLRIPRRMIEANGYLTRTGADGERIARELGTYLTYLSMFSYHIRPDGSLIPLDDASVLQAARAQRAAPLMVITNFEGRRFSPDLAHSVLASTGVQDILITNILNTLRSKRFVGLNIDFEYVRPEDRELYNQFLRRVVNRLRPEGYSISTALAPKVSADQIGLLYEAHDYPVHGQLTDFVVLMTYEWGYAAGPPWAIAPINEVRRVLNYAVTAIPRNKILMGIPTYGRDWRLPFVAGQSIAATISPQEAIARAARYGVDIQFHQLYQSPFYRYTDAQGVRHEVWFEDARSVQVKYNVVKQYGLRGVSYWELSVPFPQAWPVLENNFRIRKIL